VQTSQIHGLEQSLTEMEVQHATLKFCRVHPVLRETKCGFSISITDGRGYVIKLTPSQKSAADEKQKVVSLKGDLAQVFLFLISCRMS
jgi:hypothetical protein